MRPVLRWSGAACIAAMSLVLTGCISSVHGAPLGPSVPANGAVTGHGAAPRTPARRAATALRSIAVRDRDFSLGYTVRLVPSGNRVRGQVTLENCGFDFTTEKYRVARRQYGILNSASAKTGLSNEVVAYDTAAHAAKALRQWHTAAATCPHSPVRLRVAAEPKMRIKITRNQFDEVGLPVSKNALTMETIKARKVGKMYGLAILQVRGRYLDAVYLTERSPISAVALNAVQRLAVITGQRLAAVR